MQCTITSHAKLVTLIGCVNNAKSIVTKTMIHCPICRTI